MSDDIVFADGLKFFDPHENAPDFVLGSISVKPKDFVEWLRANYSKVNRSGYLMLSVCRARSGKPYVKLDTYEPKAKPEPEPQQDNSYNDNKPDNGDDIPF